MPEWISQIDIGIWVRGGLAGNGWQGLHQILGIDGAKWAPGGVAELDHDHATAWFGDSKGFCERLGVINCVSKAKGDGHNIKAIGFKGQIEGIGL